MHRRLAHGFDKRTEDLFVDMELPFALMHSDLETHAILPQEVLCREAIVEEVFLSLYAFS